MSAELIVRAVDTGRGNTKYTTGVASDGTPRCAMFPSLAVPGDRETQARHAGSRRLKVVDIPVGGLHYAVGPDVELVRDVYDPQVLQHDRYCLTDEYMALTIGALYYMKVERIDLLVVGLPVATMRQPKTVAALEKRLAGEHSLPGRRKVTVEQVRAIAQPTGALLRYGFQNNRIEQVSKQKNLIVDPGRHTFDWIVADGMVPVERRSNSLPVGMFTILRSIAQGISRDANTDYRDYAAIDAALRGATRPEITLFQKPYPLSRYLPLALKLAENAVAEMLHYVGDASDIANIVVVGGGSFFFRKALRDAFIRHKLSEMANPLTANVEGFHLGGIEVAKSMTRSGAPQGDD